MQVGIVGFGAYIPFHRLKKKVIGEFWGKLSGSGEKAVANWDEDSLTMAIEACIDCLGETDRSAIEGLAFASTSAQYLEKQSASLMRKVLDLKPEVLTTDISNSLRGATIALKIAMDAIKAGSATEFLVASSDVRIAAPKSKLEMELGDGAAALLIGSENLIATIDGHYTLSSEFIDIWKREKDNYIQIWEERFVLTEGYQKLMAEALSRFFAQRKTGPKDYAKVVISAPNSRTLRTVAKMIGFDFGKQVSSLLLDRVGNTGTALPLMMLAEALEKSKPGDRILFASHGDGVDVFDITVQKEGGKARGGKGIEKHLDSSIQMKSYGKYLQFRNMMDWEHDLRPPDKSSLPVIHREADQIFSLSGSKCRNCGTVQYPQQRICTQCQSKDEFDGIQLSNQKGTVFTFSLDEIAMVPDLPNVLCIVDLDCGGRFYSVMTDRIPEKIKIGMPVEMTFRKIHTGSGLLNYFWKTRPLRG